MSAVKQRYCDTQTIEEHCTHQCKLWKCIFSLIMSIIPSMAAGSKKLRLYEINSVENSQEQIPEIAKSIASHPTISHISTASNRDLENPMIVDAVILNNPCLQDFCLRSCEIDLRMLLRILHDMLGLESLELFASGFVNVEVW